LDAAQVCDCDHALANALITQKPGVSAAARKKLGILVSKYLSE
jgi:hypothetical protein